MRHWNSQSVALRRIPIPCPAGVLRSRNYSSAVIYRVPPPAQLASCTLRVTKVLQFIVFSACAQVGSFGVAIYRALPLLSWDPAPLELSKPRFISCSACPGRVLRFWIHHSCNIHGDPPRALVCCALGVTKLSLFIVFPFDLTTKIKRLLRKLDIERIHCPRSANIEQ